MRSCTQCHWFWGFNRVWDVKSGCAIVFDKIWGVEGGWNVWDVLLVLGF
jgi:hypothetical protein